MNCTDNNAKRLRIETDLAIYEVRLGQIQIEITGKCNMRCKHCRAAFDQSNDMPIEQIIKILNFGRQFSMSYSELVLSGGEPLLHKQFYKIIEEVRKNGTDEITITTNGSVVTAEHVRVINEQDFRSAMLSVSLDSLDQDDHDEFRGYSGAFEKALKAIGVIISNRAKSTKVSVRVTLRPHQIDDIPKMVKYVYNLGCDRISLSSIHPSGRAIANSSLWMDRDEKRRFIETVYELRKIYPLPFHIDTNDPLKCLVRGFSEVGEGDELIFDGCPAAAATFNVNANGDMTPCALLNLPIMNVFGMSIEKMTETYRQNYIVKNMLDMNLGGKCGKCALKYQCGGCRARAYAVNGDYLAEDPHCWL